MLCGVYNGQVMLVSKPAKPKEKRLIGSSSRVLINNMVKNGLIELQYVNPNMSIYTMTPYGFSIWQKCRLVNKSKRGYRIDD